MLCWLSRLEHRVHIAGVAGSSPAQSTRKTSIERLRFFVCRKSRARRRISKNLSDEYERKTPFAKMEMRSGNCMTKAKGGHLQWRMTTRGVYHMVYVVKGVNDSIEYNMTAARSWRTERGYP